MALIEKLTKYLNYEYAVNIKGLQTPYQPRFGFSDTTWSHLMRGFKNVNPNMPVQGHFEFLVDEWLKHRFEPQEHEDLYKSFMRFIAQQNYILKIHDYDTKVKVSLRLPKSILTKYETAADNVGKSVYELIQEILCKHF